MLHRFPHIGDLHLGPNSRNADRLKAFDQVLEECLALDQLATWLVPGDLNHARMTIDDRNALASRLQRMAERAPVVICTGNHDLPGDLDIFALLDSRWPILVVSSPAVLNVDLATGATAVIFVLPYPSRAGFVAAGTASSNLVAAAREALGVIFMDAAAKLDQARAAGAIPLMIGHINIAGSLTSVGQPNIGEEIEIDGELLARLGACYKGLNHIHRGQEIAGAWYPGSICRLDWGEIEPKRYLLVEASADGFRVLERPIDVMPMYHVEGVLSRDGFAWHVMAGPGGEAQPAPASWRGCEVRVRYRYRASEKNLLAEQMVREAFAEASRLSLEPIAVPDRALRSPEVAAARTLTDKVRVWCEHTGHVLTDAVIQKLARLEHGDPTQLLSEIANELAALEAYQTITEEVMA